MFACLRTLSGLDISDITETPHGLQVVRAWLALLAERGITSGPLLRRVDACGRSGGQPDVRLACRGPANCRLSGQAVGIILARAARASGVADLCEVENVRAHGLRAGGDRRLPRAALVRFSSPATARAGRTDSPTVLRYIRDVDRWKHNALTGADL